MSSRPTRLGVAVAGAAAAALILSACSGTTKNSSTTATGSSAGAVSTSSANPSAPTKTGLKIAFLPKQVNNSYFTIADTGGKTALTALGESYEEVGTTSATDTAGQANYVNTLIQQQVNGIALSAQDPNALCTNLKQAMADGISVVTYDSDTAADCRDLFISQASSQALGTTEVDLLASQIDDSGQIAILSAAQTATNQNAWIGYMQQELKKFPDRKSVV